jgi:hypothetical protein
MPFCVTSKTCGSLHRIIFFGFVPLLFVDPSQNRQAEVRVAAKGRLDDAVEDCPVVAEAEDLVLFGK